MFYMTVEYLDLLCLASFILAKD